MSAHRFPAKAPAAPAGIATTLIEPVDALAAAVTVLNYLESIHADAMEALIIQADFIATEKTLLDAEAKCAAAEVALTDIIAETSSGMQKVSKDAKDFMAIQQVRLAEVRYENTIAPKFAAALKAKKQAKALVQDKLDQATRFVGLVQIEMMSVKEIIVYLKSIVVKTAAVRAESKHPAGVTPITPAVVADSPASIEPADTDAVVESKHSGLCAAEAARCAAIMVNVFLTKDADYIQEKIALVIRLQKELSVAEAHTKKSKTVNFAKNNEEDAIYMHDVALRSLRKVARSVEEGANSNLVVDIAAALAPAKKAALQFHNTNFYFAIVGRLNAKPLVKVGSTFISDEVGAVLSAMMKLTCPEGDRAILDRLIKSQEFAALKTLGDLGENRKIYPIGIQAAILKEFYESLIRCFQTKINNLAAPKKILKVFKRPGKDKKDALAAYLLTMNNDKLANSLYVGLANIIRDYCKESSFYNQYATQFEKLGIAAPKKSATAAAIAIAEGRHGAILR